MSIFSSTIVNMSIETPDGVLDVTNATLRVPQIEVQGTSVTTSLSTLSNVGVGTASPDGRLHVYGPDAKTLLQSTSNTANVEIGGPSGAIVDLKGPFTDDYDLRIQSSSDGGNLATTGNVNHIRLASASGYTGFGTSAPQYKIDVQGVKGVDAVSNPSAYNAVFLYDDQESTTTFSGTVGGTGASRDTSSKYLELNSLADNVTGYVYWPIQMPNSWSAEFDYYVAGGDGGESVSFSFFNTSAPTTTGNHGGYRLAIAENYGGSPAAKVVLYYQGSEVAQSDIASGIPTSSWNKVVVNYNRGSISLSFNGRSVFSYEATENADSYTGRYTGFIGKTNLRNNYHRVRNVKCTSGTNWVYATGSNATTLAYLSGNVGIGTDVTTERLEISGNVKATHFVGDGGLLSNIATTLNAIVNQGNTTSNTVQFTNADTGIVATGNIVVEEGGFFVGDGSKLVNIPTDFESIIVNGNTTSNVVFFANTNVAIQASGNIVVDSDSFFIGNGGLLSNIATTLEDISNQGNTTSNTIQFTNSDIGFVTTANVGIANSAPTNHLSVGSNLHVNDTGSNVLTVHGNVAANTLTLGDFQVVASYGLNHVTAENNQTGDTLVLTNATTGLTTSSNIDLGGQLNFDSNVKIVGGGTGTYVNNLRIAPVASNIVTYDRSTGEVFDSGGLISNKLAIVSEQPPVALTGDSTVIDGHGRYKVTTSLEAANYQSYKAFDKTIGRGTAGWSTGAVGAYNSNGTYAGSNGIAGVNGEWVKIEFPYKTTLRHVALASRDSLSYPAMPEDFSIVASNDDSTWVVLKSVDGQAWSSTDYVNFVVDASTAYKYYAIVVELTNNNFAQIGEWKLFTESLSVDGGIVTTTAASGLETGFTEHPVAPMTGFNTYVEGHGTYEASASSYDSTYSLYPWRAFDNNPSLRWTISTDDDNYNVSTGEWDQTAIDASPHVFTSDVGGTRYHGHWLQIKLPYAITLSHSNVHPTNTILDRPPKDGVILGSNDGDNWYKLTQFTGKTYTSATWTRIDVNATTPYQYFRMCATKNGGDSKLELTEWRLFSATGVTKMDNVLISGELAVDGGALQTSHIKWPKVPLKANESEGYVASASSLFSTTNFYPYYAFNDLMYGNFSYVSETGSFSNYLPVTSRTTGNDTFNHEWLQIQLPQAITLSYFLLSTRIHGTYGNEKPKAGRLYASNDGITWDKITTFDNLTYTATGTNSRIQVKVDVKSTQAYKYYRLAVTEILHESGSASWVYIEELQLFESTLGVGTSATTAKLTVDGGLGLAKGSQVFAGSDVITEFPKHDRPLTKYPEVAMTSGTMGGYTTSSSSDSGSNYRSYKAFDGTSSFYITASGKYNTSNGSYTGSNTFEGIPGETLSLTMPKKIKLQHIRIRARSGSSSDNAPKKARIFGSNDNSTWVQLWTFDEMGLDFTNGTYKLFVVNAEQYYNAYTFVIEEGDMEPGTTNSYVSIRELEYYGHEEGDESVDVVHWSIPNTPGTQQLAVYYEARDPNSYSFADSSNVYDLSGSGATGTLTGGVGFDAEYNAFTFDGVNDYITSSDVGISGAQVLSMSAWLKTNSSGDVARFGIGTYTAARCMYFTVNNSVNSYYIVCNANNNTYTGSFSANTWLHVTMIYLGGIITTTTLLLYINGVLQTPSTGPENSAALNLPSPCELRLGRGIDGGYTSGSIANFRVYGKALNADQVRELYEYDAERFGHRQNLVALHKGNLGVGVTNPTSRFEVAGADGLQEYPPKAMTGYETYMEGHGVFRASSSSFLDASEISGWTQDFPTWYAFNKSNTQGWISNQTKYSNSTGIASTSSDNRFGIRGEWLEIEMPSKIKLKHFTLSLAYDGGDYSDAYNTSRFPQVFNLYKSNDGITWTPATEITTPTAPVLASYGSTQQYVIDENEYYNRYLIQVKQTFADGTYTGGQSTHTAIGEWRLFGTPAPSSLEDGHLTLGKALTLPRVSGHPAGAETPRVESLVVHYDTTVDSVVSGSTVVDISGNGINGTLTGATYSSTDRALTFDGVDDYVSGSGTGTGAWVHTQSFWFKADAATDSQYITFMGTAAISQAFLTLLYAGKKFTVSMYGQEVTSSFVVQDNTWYHGAVTYVGGAFTSSNVKLYINGTAVSTTYSGTLTPNITGTSFSIGARTGGSNAFNGSISNFKLWGGVALTAEEVAAEYALGRTGKSINLTDTSLCLGGTVPRAQLDVRGSARFDGHMGIGNQPTNADDGNAYPDTFPASSLHIHQATAVSGNDETQGIRFSHPLNVGRWNLFISDNNHFRFAYNGIGIGYVDQTDPNAQMNFTGQHRTFIKDIPFTRAEDLEGLIVSADNNKYIKMSGGIEAGSNAITTNESLPVVSLSTKVNDKKCFGVISGSEDPDTRQEQYGNFVSVSQKELGDTRVYINSVGEGAMWVVNTAGALESGDYITTSNVAGYGQRQESDSLKNYTVAKITMDCDFNPQDQPIQRIKQSNVVETHYTGLVPVVKGVPHEFVTTTVTADDEWSNVSVSPSDVTYAEWSNLEANVQNTYTLTYTQTSNVVYDVKYTKTTTANVTAEDAWDAVHIEPSTVTYAEYSNLEANVQNTYSLTYTMTTKVEATEAIYSNLSTEDKEFFMPTYYHMVEQRVNVEYPGAVKHETVTDRLENVLDEHGQLQWEDDPSGATEKAYKIRYLDVSGQITDEANAVHTAAFVGVTYHCG
jgi:hypothetical protein